MANGLYFAWGIFLFVIASGIFYVENFRNDNESESIYQFRVIVDNDMLKKADNLSSE